MNESRAYDLRFTEIDILGEKCLFTESRVRVDTIPLPLQRYEARYGDERDGVSIEANVDNCFSGTVIMQSPLDLGGRAALFLGKGQVDFYEGPRTTVAAFADKHGIETKPRSGKSTRSIGLVEFADDFAGSSKYGYHLSFDGLKLMLDGEKRVYEKRLQTDKFVYFASEDHDVMFATASDGTITELVSDNYFAGEGFLDSLEAIATRADGERAVFIDDLTRRYLPEMARDHEWSATGKDAMKIMYHDVKMQDTRALFTESTVSPDSVPKSLHVYDIDSDPANPQGKQKLSKHAYVNFSGTLITERPLDLGGLGHAYIKPKDVSPRSDALITLKQFAREAGVRIRTSKDLER